MSRRPSVSVHDYPEHLNPFNDELANTQPHLYRDGKTKDAKHKFWTFGRGKKKRSHSFSIKSTWNGLFGKRKDDKSEAQEKRSTITTVSTTYKRDSYIRVPPTVPPRVTKDQQDFDDALGTLIRRRKYTLDNTSSRYDSNLTVNGDPARIYDGSPKDTTTSIMGDLTPKPPARRFGQVSPKPRDKIPALDFDNKESNENEVEIRHEKTEEMTPVPPMRRFGYRASQRTSVNTLHPEEEVSRSGDTTISDEIEPADYAFKRYSQDAHRKSNLSINSCVSVGSTMSSFGRKKRRAPQPPRRDAVQTDETSSTVPETTSVELRIVESTDIAKVTENIEDLTEKTGSIEESKEKPEANGTEDDSVKIVENNIETSCDGKNCSGDNSVKEEEPKTAECTAEEEQKEIIKEDTKENEQNDVQIEYRRNSQENIEIIKDVDDVSPRKKGSTSSLSRSDSFSVKDEIEKIERAIKELEMSASKKSEENGEENRRHSILENRRLFFQNMVGNDKDPIKIEFKEFPREQKEIRVVRLNESPVSEVASRDPVKVVELHISEPIKQRPEILADVNPIPKPRRHNSLNLKDSHDLPKPVSNGIGSIEPIRGKSL